MKRAPRHALTVDVEDWFHILDAEGAPDRASWEELPSRVERNVNRLLDLFAQYGVRTTQFWLGWAAERYPALLRRAQREGHEIASHGHDHLLAYQAGRAAFAADIARSKRTLEELTGVEVVGFRVPGFSFTADTPWAYEELARAGYRYSSSIFPATRGHGGYVGADPDPHPVSTAAGEVTEIPISTIDLLGRRVCIFGGGYLRITPWPLLARAVDAVEGEGRSVVFYLHPREIDAGQPKMPQISPYRAFKYYVNLAATESKLRKLLRSYRFTTLAAQVAGADHRPA